MKPLLRPLAGWLFLALASVRAETPVQPVALLNGKDLAAFELVAAPAAPPAKGPATEADLAAVAKYHADGSLAVAGKPVSYLATKIAYENYRLHAEWRWPADAAKNSNGGVLLHVTGGPTNSTAWPVCFQVQLKPTRGGDLLPMNGAKFAEKLSTAPDAKTPQLDRLIASSSEKPLGEWNTCDIDCRGDTIEVTINGVAQNRITLAAPARGKIGFQLEGTPFEMRNVRIEPLPRAIGSSFQIPPGQAAKKL